MADFTLANEKNFQTALLVHAAFPRAAEKLISEFARRIECTLNKKSDWKVISNTLAETPGNKHVELTWAPAGWKEFGWGICLSPQYDNTRDVWFGIIAPSAANQDKDVKNGKYRAMPDKDRIRLGKATASLLVQRDSGPDIWSPHSATLSLIRNWRETSTLTKIAYAVYKSGEPDLVQGESMDDYIVNLFIRAKEAIFTHVPDWCDIRPVSG